MSTRDQAIADSTRDPIDVVGRCRAHDCPNIWTHKETGLCRWHSAADPHDWPRVSDELQREVTDRAYARQNAEPQHVYALDEKREILGKLRTLFTREPAEPRAWAYALESREKSGEKLSLAQRTMWRTALNRVKDGQDVAGGEIDSGLRASGDLPWPDEQGHQTRARPFGAES